MSEQPQICLMITIAQVIPIEKTNWALKSTGRTQPPPPSHWSPPPDTTTAPKFSRINLIFGTSSLKNIATPSFNGIRCNFKNAVVSEKAKTRSRRQVDENENKNLHVSSEAQGSYIYRNPWLLVGKLASPQRKAKEVHGEVISAATIHWSFIAATTTAPNPAKPSWYSA